MTFGPGRLPKTPIISSITPLRREDLASITRAKNSGAVQRFRDSHHMVARLFAAGLRPGEVAEESGYSLSRVSILSADPAFQELIAIYRKDINASFRENSDEYFATINKNRIIAARLLNDKLSAAEPDDLTISQLVAVHADAADRTGYPKRSVAVNVNVDFAAQLDRTIKRTREAQSSPPRLISSRTAGGGGVGPVVDAEVPAKLTPMATTPAPLRRRA